MENPVSQPQIQPNENISEVENPSARINPPQEGAEAPSVLQRLKEIKLLKLSRKNIVKGILLVIIIAATCWMASNLLHQTLVRDKVPIKFGRGFKQAPEIAAPDDVGYRSFYFYNQMVKVAKENVLNKKFFTSANLAEHDFGQIDFWELYGLFKVVKAIQLANGYDNIPGNDSVNLQEEKKYNSIDNLTAPMNYTQYFNRVADQGGCASCYSFPIAATIEYQITKKTGKKIKLSEQELIDCSNPDPQANGCAYGNMTRGFEYARDHGLIVETEYPYRSQAGHSFPCNKEVLTNPNSTVYRIKSFRSLPMGNCKAIQYELAMGNTVAAMMNVGDMHKIRNYSQPYKSCPKTNPNHGITIVGQTENQDWIIRNSWGETWGNKGYFIIKKGNTCGVCNHAFVPELAEL